jgi:hypothetical protein
MDVGRVRQVDAAAVQGAHCRTFGVIDDCGEATGFMRSRARV